MKQRFLAMLAALALICGLSNMAWAFNVPQPVDNAGRKVFVVDTAGKISQSDLRTLNEKAFKINRESKNEIGVLVTSSLGGEDIADVAHQVFNTWHIGKKDLDNGVLLLIAVNDRKMRIETGKGVGGELPDIKVKHILDDVVRPQLKTGNFFRAVNDGIDAIATPMETRKAEPTPAAHTSGPVTPTAPNPATTSPVPAQDPRLPVSPRTNSGGCATAPESNDGSGFLVVLLILGGAVAYGIYRLTRRSNVEIEEEEYVPPPPAKEVIENKVIVQSVPVPPPVPVVNSLRDTLVEIPTPPPPAPKPVEPPPSFVNFCGTTVPKSEPVVSRHQRVSEILAEMKRSAPAPVPYIPPPAPKVEEPKVSPVVPVVAAGVVATAAVAGAVLLDEQRKKREEQERAAKEEAERNEAHIRREAEETERRRRQNEEDRRAREERERQQRARDEEDRREREERRRRQEEEDRREREERARRQREEEDERRRQREREEEEDRRRRESYSSSSYDYGSSSSSSSSYDSGSSFGGGDSGGGGASSDW
jgi:uncharacterized protein